MNHQKYIKTTIMIKVLLFLLSFSLLNVCMAQETSPPDTPKTFKYQGIGFYFTIIRPEFSPEIRLNSLLHENGYPRMRKFTLNWGFGTPFRVNWGLGAQYRIGMLVIKGDLLLDTYTRENERQQLKRSVINRNVLLSYYVKKIEIYKGANTMYLYPFIGFSKNQTNLFLTRPSTTQPINDLLASPNNALHLRHNTNGFTFGFGADFGSLYDKVPPSLVSIKIGYRFSMDGAVPWKAPATTIPDAPGDHFNQFFIHISVGGMFNWGGKKK